ncbi:MAG: hypothetical protein IH856_19830 [Deltaproteobacteria bacterium]|nr:hypothetical protein [Deltaproteobacteria bacterium]
MASDYFSDRERGPRARTEGRILSPAWGGIVALINGAIVNGGFGATFPSECPDGRGVTGTDFQSMGLAVRGEIPEIAWPLDADSIPDTLAILDLVEFSFARIAKPEAYDFHSFFSHDHLNFDQESGRAEFRVGVNRIFARNRLAYELEENGRIIRLAAPIMREALTGYGFASGDQKLDELLETARAKFLDPDPGIRREGLEKLWDAFERLKTIEPGRDKKASANALIEKSASEPTFKALLDEEAKSLTDIGNTFHIRHSETSQIALESEAHVDYLFHRLFAFVWLLLQAR